jgi:hypothetical protein
LSTLKKNKEFSPLDFIDFWRGHLLRKYNTTQRTPLGVLFALDAEDGTVIPLFQMKNMLFYLRKARKNLAKSRIL